ncbi:hypothetical protein K470DRAFT_288961 [Piedraia hortae CBS 480.64]|uniref:Uncharacterized protein n=1 Tax=Piedraia hortae CBS 480.64 TaxID=1314780 RepID=A0A6A7BU43_9PEZI|nr:hypothetical protein K470DRAFT_288961 [Piedraia hortae CBS 480.64]
MIQRLIWDMNFSKKTNRHKKPPPLIHTNLTYYPTTPFPRALGAQTNQLDLRTKSITNIKPNSMTPLGLSSDSPHQIKASNNLSYHPIDIRYKTPNSSTEHPGSQWREFVFSWELSKAEDVQEFSENVGGFVWAGAGTIGDESEEGIELAEVIFGDGELGPRYDDWLENAWSGVEAHGGRLVVGFGMF